LQPLTTPQRPRPIVLGIRLSEAEREQIRQRAEAHGRTPSDYMRRVALGQIPALRGSCNREPLSFRDNPFLAVQPGPQG
jgi:hypothetical protein